MRYEHKSYTRRKSSCWFVRAKNERIKHKVRFDGSCFAVLTYHHPHHPHHHHHHHHHHDSPYSAVAQASLSRRFAMRQDHQSDEATLQRYTATSILHRPTLTASECTHTHWAPRPRANKTPAARPISNQHPCMMTA